MILSNENVKLQVLVFTCHDILFDSLGAEAVFTLPARR